jgi:hypothetical protein
MHRFKPNRGSVLNPSINSDTRFPKKAKRESERQFFSIVVPKTLHLMFGPFTLFEQVSK